VKAYEVGKSYRYTDIANPKARSWGELVAITDEGWLAFRHDRPTLTEADGPPTYIVCVNPAHIVTLTELSQFKGPDPT